MISRLLAIFIFLSAAVYAQDKKLIGRALLEYSIFKIDVYKLSYFKHKSGAEELLFEYKMDVKREYSKEGWVKTLAPLVKNDSKLKEKVKWLYDTTVGVKEGDKLSLLRFNNEVKITKNSKLIAKIKDKDISKLVFYPWLGEKPMSEDMKEKLLGKE